jgi:hypothetical protein
MRRVSRVSSEPPPNSTATSSSRIAAKFRDVDDMALLLMAALSPCSLLSGAS